MNETTEQEGLAGREAAAFLAAVRDNLLKPMAGEICRKQKEEAAAILKKIHVLYILAIVQLILTILLAFLC